VLPASGLADIDTPPLVSFIPMNPLKPGLVVSLNRSILLINLPRYFPQIGRVIVHAVMIDMVYFIDWITPMRPQPYQVMFSVYIATNTNFSTVIPRVSGCPTNLSPPRTPWSGLPDKYPLLRGFVIEILVHVENHCIVAHFVCVHTVALLFMLSLSPPITPARPCRMTGPIPPPPVTLRRPESETARIAEPVALVLYRCGFVGDSCRARRAPVPIRSPLIAFVSLMQHSINDVWVLDLVLLFEVSLSVVIIQYVRDTLIV
jgi:hypothetical protein